MTDTDKNKNGSGLSLDWLIGGVLSKIGETVDRVTGRGWNPSSSLATSKLIEKVKFLLDEEVRDMGADGRFAPHVLTLKMQWNKFAADSDDELEKLKNELHAATIDHINDKLYHTYAPIEIEIKTDYFTDGVRLIGGFGAFGDEEDEAAVNVTLPNINVEQIGEGSRVSISLNADELELQSKPVYAASFEIEGKKREKIIDFSTSQRFSVGRVKENEIALEHKSVSKVHASLVLSGADKLLVADTGSTNGTYVNGQRIAYGKAVEVPDGSKLRFGSVEVRLIRHQPPMAAPEDTKTEAFAGAPLSSPPAETQPVASVDPELPESEEKSPLESESDSDWGAFENIPGPRETEPVESVDSEPVESTGKSLPESESGSDWGEFEKSPNPPDVSDEPNENTREDWEI